MDRLERTWFLAHAETAAFDRKIQQAGSIVRRWLSECGRPYIAYSAGKDSSAMLHLIRSIEPSVPAIFADDGWLLPETEEVLSKTENLFRFKSRDRHASWFISWESDSEAIEDGIPGYARGHGFDGAAIGLRMEENRRRRYQAGKNREPFFSKKNEVFQCYPLASWSWEDVWSYILSRKVSYNLAYDRMAGMGVGYDRSRIGPFAVESDGSHDPLHMGQLAILKQGWPDLFNRFAERYPEARRYV